MRTIITTITLSLLCLFSAAQNVGIGTTTPAVKLDILSPSQTGLRILSGGISSNTSLEIGRTSANVSIGVAGINGDYSLGSQPGDVIIRTEDLSHRLILNNGAGNPAFTIFNGNVGIGTVTPASSAKVEINSTTQGFLPPRMTLEQRNLIAAPATGLVIWCTDCNEMQVYNGSAWRNINGSASSTATSLPAVQICSQVWTTINLDVTTYRNGDPIPEVTDNTVWARLTTGAWCYYNNGSSNGDIYGKLYNWYAVNDPRGLAPLGWHIPTDVEWTTLTTCLGGENAAGGRMKATGTSLWTIPNIASTNSSGLAVLPGGGRDDAAVFFYSAGSYGLWWSSSEASSSNAWRRYLFYNSANINRSNANKNYGLSVRCVRD